MDRGGRILRVKWRFALGVTEPVRIKSVIVVQIDYLPLEGFHARGHWDWSHPIYGEIDWHHCYVALT